MDWIEGQVTGFVDGDTFDMRIEWVGKSNRDRYNDEERIRLSAGDASEAGTTAGSAATEQLRQRLAGQNVHCDVHARDSYGRLVCGVRVVSRRQAS